MASKKTTSQEKVIAPKAVTPRAKKAVTTLKADAPVAAASKAKTNGVKVDVFDITGKVTGTISLPMEIFGVKVNNTLMAQAVRVYLANQRSGTVSTKTRGEVRGSTRKIYRQKGTGRARHGGIRAPIFVGGGIAFGPHPRDFSLAMPQKMKRAALFSALSAKQATGGIKVIDGLESLESKTKNFVAVLEKLAIDVKKRKVLLVLPEKTEKISRAARNLPGVTYMNANQLNTYEILNTRTVLMTKSALSVLEQTFLKKGTSV